MRNLRCAYLTTTWIDFKAKVTTRDSFRVGVASGVLPGGLREAGLYILSSTQITFEVNPVATVGSLQ